VLCKKPEQIKGFDMGEFGFKILYRRLIRRVSQTAGSVSSLWKLH